VEPITRAVKSSASKSTFVAVVLAAIACLFVSASPAGAKVKVPDGRWTGSSDPGKLILKVKNNKVVKFQVSSYGECGDDVDNLLYRYVAGQEILSGSPRIESDGHFRLVTRATLYKDRQVIQGRYHENGPKGIKNSFSGKFKVSGKCNDTGEWGAVPVSK
jgi:hypothetical protein